MDHLLRTPKLNAEDRRAAWYPYYAGYSEGFARWALQSMEAKPSSRVYDPWNGAGTTTFAAAAMGAMATGLDLNPSMVIISKARSAQRLGALELLERAESLQSFPRGRPPSLTADDPLEGFFNGNTVQAIRRVERALIDGHVPCDFGGDMSDLSEVHALIYTLLFRVCREAAKQKPSNPTWRQKPKVQSDLSADALLDATRRHASLMKSYIVNRADVESVATRRGDARVDYLATDPFDVLLTSPPYLTRIDYAIKMGLELAVLGLRPDALRHQMLGTPLTSHRQDEEAVPVETAEILRQIREHKSKASATYYDRFFRSYFVDYDKSLSVISSNAALGAIAGFVVQNSYYKQHAIDLAGITSKMMSRHGWEEVRRENFAVFHSLANRNVASRSYLKAKKYEESFIIFRRSM